MNTDQVPQQNARALMGRSKVLYAVDHTGRYGKAACSGWEAEEIVLDQAIEAFESLAAEAWQRARRGTGSTLAYHMYHERMDLRLLAQSTGYSKWRVRRHLRRGAFARLSVACRRRYAEALGKRPDELARLPAKP